MHGKSWMTLRTTNGIKFRSAEDNIMHLGALTEAHCSELGGHQLETSEKHGGVTHSHADSKLRRYKRGKCNPRMSQVLTTNMQEG